MEQYRNLDSAMGAENHFKNVATSKNHKSMRNIKQIFGIGFCTIIAVFVLTNCGGNKRKALNDTNIVTSSQEEEHGELIPHRDEKTGKWGYLNERGKEIISFKYDGADVFVEGLAKVKLNEKYGYIDEKGKEIIPLMYERIEFLYDLVKVKLDDKYGLYYKNGIEILPPTYTIIQKSEKEFAYPIRAFSSNELAFLDKTGNIREHKSIDGTGWNVFAVEDIIYHILPETNNVSILDINGDGEVIIPNKVAFNGKNYKVANTDTNLGCSDNITSITLPASLTIELCNCKNLTTVTLSPPMKSIPHRAFKNNVNLTTINIPESVEYIGEEAFRGCVNLTSINIPNKVKIIDQYAFSGCTGLTTINLPKSLIKISLGAFEDCTGLTEIIIPNSVKTIEAYAFRGCKNLITVFIPETVTTFDNQVFANCPKLTTSPMPSSALRKTWEDTRRADRIREYNSFIRNYPHSEYVTIAQNRIEQLNTIKKSTVELDYPKSVYFQSQATWNWSWTTEFTEKNDKAGYTLSSSTYSITKGNKTWYPPNGDSREITVNKGSGANTTMQLAGEDMRGGTFKRVWEGTDEWGNPIKAIETVILR